MQHSELSWPASDGWTLFAREWRPANPHAVLCLVHGLGEHSGRYAHVAKALVSADYALLAFDQRGHGQSQGPRGHAASYELLMDDIARLLDEAAQRFPNLPRFLYGHSMGGGEVLHFALRRNPSLTGVIATGPLLQTAFAPPAWKLALGRLVERVWPTLALSNEVDPAALSRDPAVVRAYLVDPLVHDRLSARLGVQMLAAGSWTLAHAGEFRLPLLLMHGSADRIASARATQAFARQTPGSCTLKLWDGCYHEIHNEPDRADVFAFTTDWLDRQTVIG